MTNAEARFNKSLRPRKPEGSLGRTAQDVHLHSHTAPELCLVEYGLVHSGETCYFCFGPAFVWPSFVRADSLCLACKPFPGLCARTRTGR